MPSRSVRSMLSVLGGCLLLCLSGCVTETQSGDTSTFTFALWVSGSILLGGLAAMVGGWFLRTRSERWGWGLMIGGLLAVAIFAPTMFSDKATVSPELFTLRTGFFFAPTRHEVRFADVARMDLTKEVKPGRRGRKDTSYYLNFHLKAGESRKVPIGDLMKNGALERVLVIAATQNIPVADLTGG